MLLVLIVTEITEATGSYCATSNKLYFAKIWLTLINLVSTAIAIFSVLKFYKALKPNIDSRKPLSKLVAIQRNCISQFSSEHDIFVLDFK